MLQCHGGNGLSEALQASVQIGAVIWQNRRNARDAMGILVEKNIQVTGRGLVEPDLCRAIGASQQRRTKISIQDLGSRSREHLFRGAGHGGHGLAGAGAQQSESERHQEKPKTKPFCHIDSMEGGKLCVS